MKVYSIFFKNYINSNQKIKKIIYFTKLIKKHKAK